MNPRTEELAARHLDGQLNDADLVELAALLQADPEARRRFRHAAEMHAMLYEESLLRRGRLQEEPTITAPSWWCRWRIHVAAGLAAILAVAVTIPIQTADRWDPSLGQQQDRDVAVTIPIQTADRGPLRISSTGKVEVQRGDGVQSPAYRLRTGPDGQATLQWSDDGTQVEVAADSVIEVAVAAVKELRLRQGSCTATVAPQPEHQPFILRAEDQEAEVLGTRFSATLSGSDIGFTVVHGAIAVGPTKQPDLRRIVAAGETMRCTAGDVRIESDPRPARRTQAGLVASWDFDEGAGLLIHDRSGLADPLDLRLASENAGHWEAGGLTLLTIDALTCSDQSGRLRRAFAAGAITLEVAWSGPSPNQVTMLEILATDKVEWGCIVDNLASSGKSQAANHLALRCGPGLPIEVLGNGRRLGRIPAAPDIATIFQRIAEGPHPVLNLIGAQYVFTQGVLTRLPPGVTVRRITLYDRRLTWSEMQGNARVEIDNRNPLAHP